jgi:hypothetical protein
MTDRAVSLLLSERRADRRIPCHRYAKQYGAHRARDKQCREALDLPESKRLLDGGFPADALFVLKEAGRL